MKNKYTKEDVLRNLRGQSKAANPSADFKAKLEKKLLSKTKSNPIQLIIGFLTMKPAYLGTIITLSVMVVAVFALTSYRDVTLTKSDSDSPYLESTGISVSETSDSYENDEGSISGYIGDFLRETAGRRDADVISDSESDMLLPESGGDYSPLSGGAVNDNADYYEFLEYLRGQSWESGLYNKINNQRYLIEVKDSDGKSVPFKEILITDSAGNEFRLNTYSNGYVYFYPGAYGYDQSSVNGDLSYQVAIENKIYGFLSDTSKRGYKWELTVNGSRSQSSTTTLDLVFTVDTTGSMRDQIDKLKETIGSISNNAKQQNPSLNIRYGLVAYRDRNEDYVTDVYDFTTDLQQFQTGLDRLEAEGGGDYAEDMNSGLRETVEGLDWSSGSNSVRLAFLIADAPPHMDYQQDYTYESAMFRSLELGIKIFPIASSGLDNSHGELMLRKVAAVTNAEYIFITNSTGGTDYHVEDNQYQVSNLDGLVIDVINREVGAL